MITVCNEELVTDDAHDNLTDDKHEMLTDDDDPGPCPQFVV